MPKKVDLSSLPSELRNGYDVVQADELCTEETLTSQNLQKDNDDDDEEDVELWIFQCNKNIDIKNALENKKIKLKGDSNYISNGKGFLSMQNSTFQNNKNLVTIIPDHKNRLKIYSNQLKGMVQINNSIDDIPSPNVNCKKRRFQHELPEDLKDRDPYFGISSPHLIVKKEKKNKRHKP